MLMTVFLTSCTFLIFSSFLDDQNEEKDPLLGHFSMVLDMCLSVDGKALVTADRDEKVRVTELPAGVEIRHFLLGHESYVNSVNIFENYIISSGNFKSGSYYPIRRPFNVKNFF
jgi:tRNA (guanine-N(7)-)-methyltransferase subunit TRM82